MKRRRDDLGFWRGASIALVLEAAAAAIVIAIYLIWGNQ
jgi:hypothetical protein